MREGGEKNLDRNVRRNAHEEPTAIDRASSPFSLRNEETQA